MIIIGKFREIYKDDSCPSIFSAIREGTPEAKEKIILYMKNATVSAFAPGFVYDVIDGKHRIGNLKCYTDGKYLWRSDIIYYFDKYNLELPKEFVDHILNDNNGDEG